MNLRNASVAARLAIGFGITVVLLFAISALGMYRMTQIEDRLDEVVDVNMRKMELLTKMSTSVHIVQRVTRTLILLGDTPAAEHEMVKIVAARKHYDDAFASLEKMATSEAGAALRRKTHEATMEVRPINSAVIDLARAGKMREATDLLMQKAIPANQKWIDMIEENIALQEKNTATDVEEARRAFNSARTTTLLLTVAAIISALLSCWIITRGLLRQLGGEPVYATEVADRIASGDLSVEVNIKPGDSSSMLYAMRTMRENLARLVTEVRQGTDAVASASAQIASGNFDLSSRTEQQASSLEETAASVEELTSTVKQNADHARNASALATTASGIAAQGGKAVAGVVETMDAISESSKKIVDIISVIDGIAFQTNILALNAAVEAARAGEQGRGFAVVATEVRSLAQRSAAAAREIKLLIDTSAQKVAAGSEQVGEAGATMQRVVQSVKEVSDLIHEIMVSSNEQSSGIEQINDAVTHMDGVTQQNAALVEEAAAASSEMKDQAQRLSSLVAAFRLDGAFHAPQQRIVPAVGSKPAPAALRKPAAKQAAVVPVKTRPLATAAGGDWEEF
jgi:methyl-accepting chemotaxis protein